MKRLLLYLIVLLMVCQSNELYAFAWRDSAYLNIKVNNDATTELQNEEQIVMNPKDTTNLVAVWRDFRLGYRQVGYGYSFDGGLTWGQGLFEEPQYIWDSDPGLTVDTAGNFYAVILSYTGNVDEPNGLFVFKSTDGGMTWSKPVTVINGVPDVFEDKELIACDRSGGSCTGNLYVSWARFGYGTEILMSRSTDGGNSFIGPVLVSTSIYGGQWSVPCVGPNSEVYVAWWTIPAMRFNRSTDGGQSFGTDTIIQYTSYDTGNLNGGIWVFSFPAMDVDITEGLYNGNIYVAYMDDSSGVTDTDIYFTRSTDGGATWSEKIRINDDPFNNGCDQFHPWLMVAPDGSIIVVFLDRRLDPGNLLMDLYMTTSTDGGDTWSPNERITTVSSDPTAGSKGAGFERSGDEFSQNLDKPIILADRAGLLGEYIGVTASSINDIHPIWTDTRLGHQDVFVGVGDTAGQYVQDYLTDGINDPILSIWPSPAKGRVNIEYSIAHSAEGIGLKIFDVSGRLIKQFNYGTIKLSNHIVWNRRDDTGTLVKSGVYFCMLKFNQCFVVRKFILLSPIFPQ